MAKKPWFPFDLKTGRLAFSPVLRSTGERLSLEVDHDSFPHSKAPGFHGVTQDLKSGQWYAVYGKECDIPKCNCDAWVEPIEPPDDEALERFRQQATKPSSGIGSIGALREDAGLLDEIVADAYRRRREDKGRDIDL